MIRLRDGIVRWLRHPAVGPVLLVLLAVALAFLALHEAWEGSIESLLAACATLAAALAAVLLFQRRGNDPVALLPVPARARPPEARRLESPLSSVRPLPLRL